MKAGTIMSRDDVSVSDLFDMNTELISQINMLETVAAILTSVVLADHGQFEAAAPDGMLNTALDCLSDFLAEFDRMHRERDAAISFLNSRE
jgi:hypothetical protein